MAERLSNWPLFPVPDADGRIDFPNLEQSVRQSIQIILRTKPGEQLMRPNFGGGLENFLHEQNTLLTRRRISDAVQQSLLQWEKRITVDRVDVWEVEDNKNIVKINIAYRLNRTNMPSKIGVTLEMGA